MPSLAKGDSKLQHAWAFYDWANSAYNLTITSAIFPIFWGAITIIRDDQGKIIRDSVSFLGYEFNNDALMSYVTAAAFLVVSFLSPLLSGVADHVGNKKVFMKFFCYLGAFSCIGLYWFSIHNLFFGLLCYFLALIGFWSSLVFYNAFLPEVAYPDQQDKVSAKGYALGYIGSVILLLVNLIMILRYEWFGFENSALPTRISFIMVGVWWMGFSQYSFYYLPKVTVRARVGLSVLFKGFKSLKKVANSLKKQKKLRRYLLAFFVYSMAVQTIMLIATYFGIEELEWGDQDATSGLVISILLIQLVAIGGAYLTAKASKKYGNIPVLITLNAIWIAICAYAYTVTIPFQFYCTAAIVGLVMGGIQSLSRSTYSKLLPDDVLDTTAYFSFYDVSEKIGIVIGMFSYGFVVQCTGSIRDAILFFILFFAIGLGLLLRVRD